MTLLKAAKLKQINRRIGRAFLAFVIVFAATVGSTVLPQNRVDAVAGFNSTVDPNILPMLNGFKTLGSSTLSENNNKLLAINNGATSTERTAASQADGYPKPGNTYARYYLSNTEYLGGIRTAYLAANAANEVPLVNTLLAEANDTQSTHFDLNSEWSSADNAKDTYKNPRPYCTSLNASIIRGSGSGIYNDAACATGNYSFPSGHSRLIWVEGVSLSIMLPEVAPQIMARSAEVANYRVVLGVHYPLDIMAGRAVATRMVAARLHDDTWRAKFDAAKTQLRNAIIAHCGTTTVQACVDANPPTMSTADALALERDKLTYGFTQNGTTGVPLTTTPSYAYELLSEAFLGKTTSELNQILKDTAIDSGYPLDTTGTSAGTENIGWTRFDLAKALTYTDPVQPNCTSSEFADVSTSSPFCSAINWMKDQGISLGYNDNGVTTFHPSDNVTREAMSAFLYRYAHPGQTIPTCSASSFADVSTANPFCGAIEWMAQQGISLGYNDNGVTTFHPSDNVSREAMSAFLYRYAHPGQALPVCTSSSFTDVSTSSPFCSAINWMKDQGISTGYDNGTAFHPSDKVTREAMSAFLYRYAHL